MFDPSLVQDAATLGRALHGVRLQRCDDGRVAEKIERQTLC